MKRDFFGPQQHHREYTTKDVVNGVCFAGTAAADNTTRCGERKIRRIDNLLTYYQGHVGYKVHIEIYLLLLLIPTDSLPGVHGVEQTMAYFCRGGV